MSITPNLTLNCLCYFYLWFYVCVPQPDISAIIMKITIWHFNSSHLRILLTYIGSSIRQFHGIFPILLFILSKIEKKIGLFIYPKKVKCLKSLTIDLGLSMYTMQNITNKKCVFELFNPTKYVCLKERFELCKIAKWCEMNRTRTSYTATLDTYLNSKYIVNFLDQKFE